MQPLSFAIPRAVHRTPPGPDPFYSFFGPGDRGIRPQGESKALRSESLWRAILRHSGKVEKQRQCEEWNKKNYQEEANNFASPTPSNDRGYLDGRCFEY